MRTLLTEATIGAFWSRFEAFHDTTLLAVHYDFDARDEENNRLHRVGVRINTPDWSLKQRPLKRINVLFEFETIDYILMRKQQNRFITRIAEIELQFDDDKIIADFFPYQHTHPMRRSVKIHKHYEGSLSTENGAILVLIASKCYWSILSVEGG